MSFVASVVASQDSLSANSIVRKLPTIHNAIIRRRGDCGEKTGEKYEVRTAKVLQVIEVEVDNR